MIEEMQAMSGMDLAFVFASIVWLLATVGLGLSIVLEFGVWAWGRMWRRK